MGDYQQHRAFCVWPLSQCRVPLSDPRQAALEDIPNHWERSMVYLLEAISCLWPHRSYPPAATQLHPAVHTRLAFVFPLHPFEEISIRVLFLYWQWSGTQFQQLIFFRMEKVKQLCLCVRESWPRHIFSKTDHSQRISHAHKYFKYANFVW